MKVLGLDPGYERLGLAVLEQNSDGRPAYLYSTCLRTLKTEDFTERLGQLGRELQKILDEHQPDLVAMEQVFFMQSNRTTALKIGEVRGLIRWLASERGLKVSEFTPLEIKQGLTGYGQAPKEQVAQMVRKLLPAVPAKLLDDEMDAIALTFLALSTGRR